MTTLKALSFNIFGDGLSNDGLVTRNPDEIYWTKRGPRILAILNKAFDDGYDVVSLNENDHFLYFLEGLQSNGKNIHGSFQRVRDAKKNTNTSYNLLFKRNYKLNKDTNTYTSKDTTDNTFADDIQNESDCKAFVTYINSDKPSSLTPAYEFAVSDKYVSDSGNALYWNANKVKAVPAFREFNPRNTTRTYKCYIGRGDHGFSQVFYKDGCKLNVLSAHLPSGEGESEELERVGALRGLLAKLDGEPNIVVLMDSNSSSHYRYGMTTTIQSVLNDYGLFNAIIQDDNPSDPGNVFQCHKIRDGNGDQEQKYGSIMSDTLEMIGAKKGVSVQIIPVTGVELYPDRLRNYMYRFRTDHGVRERITNWVLDWDNRYNVNGEYVSGGAGEIRPGDGQCVPIKNKAKTVTLRMMSTNKGARWGPDARTNIYDGMAEYIGVEGVTDDTLKEVFMNLYPNDKMPSDHPPVGAIIQIEKTHSGWFSYLFGGWF